MTENLIQKIQTEIEKAPTISEGYEDLFSVSRGVEATDFEASHDANKWMRHKLMENIGRTQQTEKFFDLYKRSLLFDAPHFLDSYLLYLELNRDIEKRFYQPRRKVLKPVVDALQDLTDDKLDELFLSMPPRVGKTTLILFYFSWLIGRDPEHPNLYSSYSDVITNAFYNGVLEIITDKDTYLWRDVFPDLEIARTNAAEEIIDIGRRKHYPSMTARSIHGTLNGATDAQDGVICGDDLCSGIEEALNKDRLVSLWNKVDNNLIPRGKGKTKYLWIGTRWSVIDPEGVRLDTLENDEKYKEYRWRVINLPALNENDESNFDYPYGVGFDTLYYQRRRASFERNNDMASFLAQYMGQPIEREGTLFTPDGFRYYNGELPQEEPDRVFMAVDPAFGGGDFVAAPVCYQYGDDCYMHDVVYNDGDKRITIPLLVEAAKRNGITAIQVEANKTLESYKDEIDAALRAADLHVNLTSKAAPTNKGKTERIYDKAPEIREHMIFLENGKRSKAYSLFMQNVYSYKILGKNKNDDAPDSLAMAMDMFHPVNRRIQAARNPFRR